MLYTKIKNPISGRKVSIYSKLGKKILRNYLKQLGAGLHDQCGEPSVTPALGEVADARYLDSKRRPKLCRNEVDSMMGSELNDIDKNKTTEERYRDAREEYDEEMKQK